MKASNRILWLIGLILVSQVLHLALLMFHLNNGYFVERWTFVAGSNILLGCLISILIHSKEVGPKLIKYSGKFTLVCAASLYLSTALLFPENEIVVKILSPFIRSICISVFILYVFTNQASRLVGFLENKFLKYIGLISYGIYMYQGLFLATGPERISGVLWPPSQSIGFLLLLCIAPLSYHFFEKPFINLKSKFQTQSSYRRS